jgi:hypothetical protein
MNSMTIPGFLEVEATVTIVIFSTSVPACYFSHHVLDVSDSEVSGQESPPWEGEAPVEPK